MTFPKSLSLIALAIALGGCAVKPRCPYTDGREVCADTPTAYRAALAGGGSQNNVLEVAGAGSKNADAAPLNLKGGRHQLAGPVFQPPKPWRFWVAPWTDANGLLHSGEHVFFTTPGRWNYGPMGEAGSAGALIEPIRPEELGFKPLDPKVSSADTRREHRRNGVTLPAKNVGDIDSSRYGGN